MVGSNSYGSTVLRIYTWNIREKALGPAAVGVSAEAMSAIGRQGENRKSLDCPADIILGNVSAHVANAVSSPSAMAPRNAMAF